MADPADMPLSLDSGAPGRILIIDDEPYVLSVLYTLLAKRYDCNTATSALDALERLKSETYDLVLSDIIMPGMSGLELLSEITRLNRHTVVVLISGNLNIQSAIEAMRRGAYDYVTKPFDLAEVEAAVARALRHQRLLKTNHLYEQHLQELVQVRTNELTAANANLNQALEKLFLNYRATLRALATALEARDVETKGHSDRVVSFSLELGRKLGLSQGELIALEQGALLHDIGKIGVRDSILLKRGPLTADEWVEMREHINHGLRIISGIDFLKGAAPVVGQHHEKYNGSGYPNCLSGEQIHINARIFAVADAVDAITSDRPYHQARSFEAAVEELLRCAGTHFDPEIVKVFMSKPISFWRELREQANEPGRAYDDQLTEADIGFSVLTITGTRLTGNRAI
ncbi:MAG TPA: HD domain-containing phosphohydrolase [Blastocatellia bacterium]|nr:HD domain-containing phosphohydrolase [Blastocatellia bacterium]